MNRVLALVAAVAAAGAAQALAQQPPPAKPDLARAKTIVTQTCAACHGPEGNSVAPTNPKLAGQFEGYLYKQLTDFKAAPGKKPARVSAIMNPMVASLSEADLRSLAAYFSQQKQLPSAATDKTLAALGQKLWRGGDAENDIPACAGCHGPAGLGIPKEFPRLSGQFTQYIVAQLKAFHDGARANDPNGMMRGVTSRMTEHQMEALGQYAAGLREGAK